MSLHCVDRLGHAVIEVEIVDDGGSYPPANAKFSFRFEPAALDRFIKRLLEVEQVSFGEATLSFEV